MAKLSRETRRTLRLAATVFGVALLIALLPSNFTTPLRTVFTEALGPVEQAAFDAGGDLMAVGGTVTEMFLAEERERLLAGRVRELENEVTRLEEKLEAEGRIIRSMAFFVINEPDYEVRVAPVTSYDSSTLRRSIEIAAGSADGVGEGMAVCASGALAGVVTEAGPWRSRVRLITDPDSVIPVYAGPGRDLCMLVGGGGRELAVEWVKHETPLAPGDILTTAFMDYASGKEPLPEGLPAAEVSEVADDRVQLLFLRVRAVPRVDLDRLEKVQVLIPAKSGSPPD